MSVYVKCGEYAYCMHYDYTCFYVGTKRMVFEKMIGINCANHQITLYIKGRVVINGVYEPRDDKFIKIMNEICHLKNKETQKQDKYLL